MQEPKHEIPYRLSSAGNSQGYVQCKPPFWSSSSMQWCCTAVHEQQQSVCSHSSSVASYGLHGSSFVRLPEPRPTKRSNTCWRRPKVNFFAGRFTKCRCTVASGIVSDGCSNFKRHPTQHICRAIPISFCLGSLRSIQSIVLVKLDFSSN